MVNKPRMTTESDTEPSGVSLSYRNILESAMFLDQGVSLGDFVHFLLWTTSGNIVGGGVFVGLLNYGHVALAGEQQNVDFDATKENERGLVALRTFAE